MANYKYVSDFLNDLRQMPGEENIINENGEEKLTQDYAINRMNHIYGKGNWSISEVKNELVKNANNNTAQNICAITVEYKHPISGCTLLTKGSAPMNFSADESVMQNAFLNAISSLGATFGETLNMKVSKALITEILSRSNKLAAVI